MIQKYKIDYGGTYVFSFEKQTDGSVRPYIVSQPSYGSRDADSHKVHRLHDGTRFYVCWDTALKNEDDAQAVAEMWCRYTERYIRFGTPFPAKSSR